MGYLFKICIRLWSTVCLQRFDAVGYRRGRKAIRPVKTECWGASMFICLERGAELHMAQLMPLPLTVFCFSKIQVGSTSLVLAHLGSPGQKAVKRVCVCVCVVVRVTCCQRVWALRVA